MHTQSAPLSQAVEQLLRNEIDLGSYIDERCDRVDAVNPEIRAVLSEPDRRERLHEESETVDESDELAGIPVGVKDIIHVDGFTTRAGTAVPPELFQGPQATVVSRLRDAGALVLGKTVTTEFAGQPPGLTRNPHDLGHTPGGSSSGSAAAVAAGMCPLALGTQTGGSVIRPASYCGIVGFKPSFGRIPTDGVLPRSESLDHVGLYTQDLDGMKLAASVVCDGWTGAESSGRPTFAVPEGPYLDKASPEALDFLDDHVETLEDSGYSVDRIRVFEDFEETDTLRQYVSKGELAINHAERFEEYSMFYRTPSAQRIREGLDVTTEQLTRGRKAIRQRREILEDVMDEHGIDIWLSPASPGPAPEGITDTGNSVMNRPWTDTGFPVVTLPVGSIDGLPIGLQCATRYEDGESLLAWAEQIAETVSF